MTTTGSLNRTGAGIPHHWLASDPTGSLNRTGTGPKFCTGEIRVSMVTATSGRFNPLSSRTSGLNKTGTGTPNSHTSGKASGGGSSIKTGLITGNH